MTKDMDSSMADRNVILVEDIPTRADAELHFEAGAGASARSLRIAALLVSLPAAAADPCTLHRFTIPDAYVVGYGLDYAERYRNLRMCACWKIRGESGSA